MVNNAVVLDSILQVKVKCVRHKLVLRIEKNYIRYKKYKEVTSSKSQLLFQTKRKMNHLNITTLT